MLPPIAVRVAAVLLICSTLPALASAACICPPTPTVSEAFNSAFAIFSGRVLSTRPDIFSLSRTVVILQPYTRWEGPLGDPMGVLVENAEADCGYVFVVGGEYLVYGELTYTGLTYTPAVLVTSCSRTAPLAGNPDLALLPPPVLPVPARGRTWGTLKSAYR